MEMQLELARVFGDIEPLLGPPALAPRPPRQPLVVPKNSTLLMVSCRSCCPARCRNFQMIDGYWCPGQSRSALHRGFRHAKASVCLSVCRCRITCACRVWERSAPTLVILDPWVCFEKFIFAVFFTLFHFLWQFCCYRVVWFWLFIECLNACRLCIDSCWILWCRWSCPERVMNALTWYVTVCSTMYIHIVGF